MKRSDYSQWFALALLGIAILAVGFALGFDAFTSQDPLNRLERAKLWSEIARNAVLGLGVPLAAVGVVLALRRTRSIERQATVSAHRQVTQTFTEALTQLESTSIGVRIGAIYAMERISKTADNSSDHWMVVETLASFIRHNAPGGRRITDNDTLADFLKLWRKSPGPDGLQFLENDVQTALSVIGRRRNDMREPARIDLRGCRLVGADIERGNFADAQLEETDFRCAKVARCDLNHARLIGADFSGADLRNAILSDSKMDGARFWYAKLFDVDLSRASAFSTDFRQSEFALEGVLARLQVERDLLNMDKTFVVHANFEGARVGEIDMSKVHGLDPEQVLQIAANEENRPKLPTGIEAPWTPPGTSAAEA